MGAGARLKIEAHDASRVEFSIYIPLPRGREVSEAEVDLSLEFPETIYTPHDGWDQLQILARLSSPDKGEGGSVFDDTLDVDGVRRSALGVARRLKLLRESIPRAALAHGLGPAPLAAVLARDLAGVLDRAETALEEARAGLVAPRPLDAKALVRERQLAGEFLSSQLLELLTVADEAAGTDALRARVAAALSAELARRARLGDPMPGGDDKEGLAAFLDRAAQLKKHFQEVLFLEPESKMIDQSSRNLVGLGGAATAFVIYFALQLLQTSAVAQAGLGLGTVLFLGAFAYALKDRMKELTRQWLAGKLSHLYANRVLVLREPMRFDKQRRVVMQARESLAQDRLARPDPLNPGSGAAQHLVTLRYKQRTRVSALHGATGSAFERLKIVFRYDLSPILTRLDDSVKRVPVPGPDGVRFADAPRLYRVPMKLSVRTPQGLDQREVTIVLQRQGIARIVPATAEERSELAALPEAPEPPPLLLAP